MDDEMTPMTPDDRFAFGCDRHVPCFNECCRDLNQFLFPYDIIRLKNCLGISSGEFLERYTKQHSGPETGLPVVTLKPDYASGSACPFVTPSGCRVYENRPASCRMYPLARMVSRNRETGRMTEHYALMKEDHCLGFCEPKTQTVREWIENQELIVYNRINDKFMEIISLKNRLNPGPLDLKSRYLFAMACYDMDTFRQHIFEKGLFDDFELDSITLEKIKTDDVALLDVGMTWIQQILFS
jgi:uncharacterized protein